MKKYSINLGFWYNFDAPERWQFSFQNSGTDIRDNITDLHNDIRFFLIVLSVFIVYRLGRIFMVYKNTNTNTPKILTLQHHTSLEVMWTIVPAIILRLIALPRYIFIYNLDEFLDPKFDLKFATQKPLVNFVKPAILPKNITAHSGEISIVKKSETWRRYPGFSWLDKFFPYPLRQYHLTGARVSLTTVKISKYTVLELAQIWSAENTHNEAVVLRPGLVENIPNEAVVPRPSLLEVIPHVPVVTNTTTVPFNIDGLRIPNQLPRLRHIVYEDLSTEKAMAEFTELNTVPLGDTPELRAAGEAARLNAYNHTFPGNLYDEHDLYGYTSREYRHKRGGLWETAFTWVKLSSPDYILSQDDRLDFIELRTQILELSTMEGTAHNRREDTLRRLIWDSYERCEEAGKVPAGVLPPLIPLQPLHVSKLRPLDHPLSRW